MTLLAPGWLALAFLAGIVLVLHARRRRRVEVPTVFIWRHLESSFRPRRNLRAPPFNLPLVLQIAAILLAALALARPTFGDGASLREHVIFVVDGSGSMRATDVAPSRFEAARTAMAAAIGRYADGERRVSVVVAGATADLVIARQTDPDAMRPRLAAISAGDGEADWRGALDLAAATLRPEDEIEIILLTDDAAGALSLAQEMLPDVAVETAVFGTNAANAGLTATVVPVDLAAGVWSVAGEIGFAGMPPTTTEIAVRFSPEGDPDALDWGVIAVEAPDGGAEAAGEVAVLAFESELTLPGPGTLALQLPDDAGPHDNRVQFVLNEEPRRARILIVGQEDPGLLRALHAIEGVDLFQSPTLPPDDTAFDLIVVDDVTVGRRPNTNVLWLDRGRIAGEPEPVPLADAYLVGWDETHPLSDGIDWATLTAPRGYQVAPLAGAAIVAEAGGGPLVQARTIAAGREVRVALAIAASGWANDPSFPVFVANLVDWLGIELGQAAPTPCTVGMPCMLEAAMLSGRIIAPDGTIAWTGIPAVTEAALPAFAASFVPERAGLYRIEQDGRTRALAVNPLAGAETDIASIGGDGLSHRAGSGPDPWWWLLLAVLALLLAEAWISGRGNERFLQARALMRGAPLAGRRRAQLALRVASAAMIVAALASLPLPVREPAEAVALVVAPALEPGLGETDRGRIAGTIDRFLEASDNAALVAAGYPSRVLADLGESRNAAVGNLRAAGATPIDLAQAVALAAAMLPADRPGRVVVASDGNATLGSIVTAAVAIAHDGPPVDVVPFSDMPRGEVLVQSVAVPDQIYAGDSFTLNAFVVAAAPVDARLRLLRNGEVVSESDVALAGGTNRIEAVFDTTDPGSELFEVELSAPGDTFAENNRAGAIATIATPPSILIVTPDMDWGGIFVDALAVQTLDAEIVSPDRAPFYIDGWLRFDVVVLMNVPAIDLTTRQQELLADFVEIHGHGLLILGGEHAFGPGGYYQTPLERISPLSSRVPQDSPGAAMVFVLDRSGSMQARVEDVNRLEVAKEATLSAIDLLHEESDVSVIVFDSEAHIILPLQRKDMVVFADALRPVQPGGGTALFPALSAAIDQLEPADAEAKHIVVMTDGLLEPADFAALLQRAAAAGITVSAVAIGDGADIGRAELIARLGGGAFHATQDFKALPSILSQEALMLSSSPLRIGTSPVFWVDRSAAYLSRLPAEMPPIENYVATTARPAASLHLATIDDDGTELPVMASWRYGNGMVLSLATHGAGSGTADWLAMAQYPLIWGQIVRAFLPAIHGPGIHLDAARDGDAAILTAILIGPEGEPMSGLAPSATIVGADGAATTLAEIAPGTYRARVAPIGTGTVSFDVSAGDMAATAALHAGYPARFDFSRERPASLVTLAEMAGGEVLPNGPSISRGTVWGLSPAWRPWVAAALVFFLADLTVRYAPGLLWIGRRRRDKAEGLVATA